MYPFIRMAKDIVLARRQSQLGIGDRHVSHHLCWPWDLDIFGELNNGRTLSLFDLGRVPMAVRMGLDKVLRREGWGLAVLGTSVRYRRRVFAFDRLEIASRIIGWDDRFIYIEQAMRRKRDGETTCHALFRSAVTDRKGIVSTARLMAAMDQSPPPMTLPDWAQAWLASEAQRPWPPEV